MLKYTIEFFSRLGKLEYDDCQDSANKIVELWMYHGGPINARIPNFMVLDHEYEMVTPWQAVYLVWKISELFDHPDPSWYSRLFYSLLDDPRIDYTSRFSEFSLTDSHHFDEFPENGHILQSCTLAHLAAATTDYVVLRDLLKRDPSLLEEPCTVVYGFDWARGPDLHWDHNVPEEEKTIEIPPIKSKYRRECTLYRLTKVSVLHLSAKAGDASACLAIAEMGALTSIVDSHRKTPMERFEEYLKIHKDFTEREAARVRVVLGELRSLREKFPQTNYLLQNECYTTVFDTRLRIPICTYHTILPNLEKIKTTRPSFKVDKRIPDEFQGNKEIYEGSGYDISHQVPYADFSNAEERASTNLFTNVSPSSVPFNRGIWSQLEAHVRDVAKRSHLVEVYTGPIFPENRNGVSYKTLHGVAVPKQSFKVIAIYKNRKWTTEAYIIPDTGERVDPKGPKPCYSPYQTSIEKVSAATGLVFQLSH